MNKVFELAPDKPATPKELAGICLELGRGEEAVRVTEHAVGLNPRDPELVGNLAVAWLLAGQPKEAESTIRAAPTMNAEDQINKNVLRIIRQVANGERAQPKKLADLTSVSSSSPARSQHSKKKPQDDSLFARIGRSVKNLFGGDSDRKR